MFDEKNQSQQILCSFKARYLKNCGWNMCTRKKGLDFCKYGRKGAADFSRTPSRAFLKQSIFFGLNQNKLKLNLFRLFFVKFRTTQNFFFDFFLCFRTGIETTKTYRTNRKNFFKMLSIRVSSKQLIFFWQTETNQKLKSVFWCVLKP